MIKKLTASIFIVLLLAISFQYKVYPAAVDNHIWVPSYLDGSVLKINKSTGTIDIIIPFGFATGPTSICVDDNTVWVTLRQTKQIGKIDKATNSLEIFYNLVNEPQYLAVDDESLWVTNSNNEILRINKNSATHTTYATENDAGSIGINANFAYVANTNSQSFTEINKATNVVTNYPTAALAPWGLYLFDNSIWITDNKSTNIYKYTNFEAPTSMSISVRENADLVIDPYDIWTITGTQNQTLNKYNKATQQINATVLGNNPVAISHDFTSIWISNGGTIFPAFIEGTLMEIDKTSGTVIQEITTELIASGVGDMTGFKYDENFGTDAFKDSLKKIKCKSKNNNVASNAVDQDFETYLEPKKKKSKILLKTTTKRTIANVVFYIKIIEDDPVKLKWKFQYKKKGKWKKIAKTVETYYADQAVVLGIAIDKRAKKFRFKIANKKVNGVRGKYGITEIKAYE